MNSDVVSHPPPPLRSAKSTDAKSEERDKTQERSDASVREDVGSRALECIIGRGRFAIAVGMVRQVVELEIDPPPPLASPWVSGLGLYQGKPVVVIGLNPQRAPSKSKRTGRAVLLRPGLGKLIWAVEVNQTGSFVQAERIPSKPVSIGTTTLPSWAIAARAPDGRRFGWIDVENMLAVFGGIEAKA